MASSMMKFINHTSKARTHERKRYRHACEECRKRKRRCPHDYSELNRKAVPRIAPRLSAVVPSATASDSSRSSSVAENLPSQPQNSENHALNSQTLKHSARGDGLKRPIPKSHAVIDRPDSGGQESSPSPVWASDDNERDSSHSDSDIIVDDSPKFVGHLNPEGIFLATTHHGDSGASRLDDTLGFWLPRKSSKRTREHSDKHEVTISRDHGEDERDNNEENAGVPGQYPSTFSPKLPRALRQPNALHVHHRLKILPEAASFNALRSIYFRDVHPIFPILQPELIPEMTTRDSLAPTETILAQALCLAVATNNAAEQHLRFQDEDITLSPGKFARRLSQVLIAVLGIVGSSDRLLCVRVFTMLSLFSQLSTDDHTSAEYCARAISYVHTMQLHLDTAHVRNDDAEVTQVFLCVWALDRLNVAFHSRPLLIHARDIGRNMKDCISQQDGCFRLHLVICGLLENITDLYRPSHGSRASNDQFELAPFEDLVFQADAVRCPIHLLATIETLYHAVSMLAYRFHSSQDPDRSSMSYLRSNLSATRVVTLMETEFGTSASNFPFVPYSISLAIRVAYRELRFSKTPLGRSIARRRLLKVCTLLARFEDKYTFARRLAALARKTVRELDKVAASVLQARHDLNHDAATAPLTRTNQFSKDSSKNPSGVRNENSEVLQQDSSDEIATTKNFGNVQIPQYDPAQYTAESFGILHQISDMPDLFEHFDPLFNLEAIDSALAQNVPVDALRDFGFSPDMDWMSGSGMSSTLPDNAEYYPTTSGATW